ncbi:MAG: hypothetical protein M8357_12695 [Desulfobulbaceae bacterium]|nr:hypothetical protein [Desulfobulbaceae bacterium]
MSKKNCWEYKQCGRQPGGVKAGELGICPAADENAAEGINCGSKGGRSCWALAGTLCGGKVQGTFASKLANCMQCDFYKLVLREEGRAFTQSREIQSRIAEKKKQG